MAKVVRKVRVVNPQGLHTRPATAIVKLLRDCKSDVRFQLKKEVVNAKSILSLLMLAAAKNSIITVTIDGDDAEDMMAKVVEAFQTGFGE